MTSPDHPPTWFDAVLGLGSGAVLWILSWFRASIKENRDTHERLQRQLDRIEDKCKVPTKEDK